VQIVRGAVRSGPHQHGRNLGGNGDLFDRHTPVLLKIDAEASEPQILRALAPILERHAPDLLVEVLPGVDDELEREPCLEGYVKFLLTAHGASWREAIRADPANRDWLMTRSPRGVLEP
jgi:hypothetical protein